VKNVTLDKLISALFTRLTCKSIKVCWLKLRHPGHKLFVHCVL